ncbi:hypothetical protein CJ199_12960, partial [Brevibacterium paucivorans]
SFGAHRGMLIHAVYCRAESRENPQCSSGFHHGNLIAAPRGLKHEISDTGRQLDQTSRTSGADRHSEPAGLRFCLVDDLLPVHLPLPAAGSGIVFLLAWFYFQWGI